MRLSPIVWIKKSGRFKALSFRQKTSDRRFCKAVGLGTFVADDSSTRIFERAVFDLPDFIDFERDRAHCMQEFSLTK